MSAPTASPLTRILEHVRSAVDSLAQIRAVDDTDRREVARARLARALSGILAAERAGSSTEELDEARALIQRLITFVDERVDMAHLLRAQQQTRKRSGQLHLCRAGKLPINLDVWTSGAPERHVDWWSMCPLSSTVAFGAMGTIIGDESDAAMVGSALCGALAVARKGIGPALEPHRAHLVLHATLLDLFGSTITAPTLTWRLDTTTGDFALASAGHRSLWHIRDGVFQTLRARTGTPLGVEPATRARPLEMRLQRGDHLLGLTAGVFEVEAPDGSVLRESDLRVALLQGLARDPRQSGLAIVRETLERHARRTDWAPQATAFWLQLR